jgi:energy-coupling factor transporter ATP-binding protein EcfA2
MNEPLIEVRGLRYRYDDGTTALNGIDFQMERGESVALLGPNGSGKTTFALHLNGLLRGEGQVRVCGLDVKRENLRALRRKVGLVLQDPESQLFMPTVLEDVAFGPLNRGMNAAEATERAMAALKTVGLEAAAGRAPYHLSAGEKRRAAIAGVLATDPEILVLDEPTTFLDPPGQRALGELLASLPQSKVIVTHNIPLALAACTKAAFFQAGTIVAEGAVAEVVDKYRWRA